MMLRRAVSKSATSASRWNRAGASVRNLELQEHHAKDLCAKYGVRVQRGIVATTAEQATANAKELRDSGARDLILKSQILAGGRGKGHFDTGFKGGVKICDEPEQVGEYAKEMLGNMLITKQTPPEGMPVSKVLVHEGVDFDGGKEFYFCLLMDREFNGPVMVGSPCGGMDIEDVAEESPEKLKYVGIDIKEGVNRDVAVDMAKFMGFSANAVEDAADQIEGLYKMFIENDMVQCEVNPMVETTMANYDGKVYTIDAKLGFDESAEYRNKAIFANRDSTMEDPREVEASAVGLNYVGLDGSIGCMVNGAGLAMATMDIVKLYGGDPANFLDVGGGATEEMVTKAFTILSNDPKVKCIFVNIFGGIMKCDIIAAGCVAGYRNVDLASKGIPLVVRLAGTNVELGKQILKDSGLAIEAGDDMDDSAQKAVAAAKLAGG